MQHRTIGSSNLKVPVICLGTMTWGNKNSEADAHAQLDYAINEKGLTFIDTAEVYPIPPTSKIQGLTETYIGNWLAKTGKRENLIIASKVSPAPLIKTREVSDPAKLDRQNIRDAVEGSLSRLQTDYIDLYQIHWPVRQTNFFGSRGYNHAKDEKPTPIEETLEALQELINEGKIRNIGVSNETAWGVSEYLRLSREKNLPKIVSIQNQYSLTNRTFEIGISEFCMRENISMLPYSVLNMGVLTGKYLGGAYPENARLTLNKRNENRYNPQIENAQKAIRTYVELARKHGLDPVEMAIAFAVSREFVSSVIIGASSLEQLKIAISAGDIKLQDEVLKDIAQVYYEQPDTTV